MRITEVKFEESPIIKIHKIRSQTSIPENEETMQTIGTKYLALCKIKYSNYSGSGFFCQFIYEENGQTLSYFGLLTNFHILPYDILLNVDEHKIKVIIHDNTEFSLKDENIINKCSQRILDATFLQLKYDFVKMLRSTKRVMFMDIDKFCKESYEKLTRSDDLFILQHPDGGDASIAIGKFVEPDDNLISDTNYNSSSVEITENNVELNSDVGQPCDLLKYRVSTLYGSSGSLVFLKSSGEIVGLHIGAPDSSKYNMATPIYLIYSIIYKDMTMGVKSRIACIKQLQPKDLTTLRDNAGIEPVDKNTILFYSICNFTNYKRIWFMRSLYFWYWTPCKPQIYDDVFFPGWVQLDENMESVLQRIVSKQFRGCPLKDTNGVDTIAYLRISGSDFLGEKRNNNHD